MRQIVEENTTKLAAKVTAIRVQAERVKAAKSTIEDLNDTIDFIIDSGDQLIVQADNLKYLPEKRGGDKEFKVAELNRFLEEEKKFYSQANDSIERSLNEIQPSLKARERHVKILLIQLLSVPIISTLFIYGDLGLRQELKSFESLKFTSWILTGVVSVTLFSIFFVLFLVLDLNLFVRTKGLQSEFLKWNIFSAAFAIIVLILTLICDRLLPNLIYPLMFSLISSVTQINPINPAFVILTNIAAILGIALHFSTHLAL